VKRPFWRRRLLPAFLVVLGGNVLALAAWTGPRTLRLRNATERVEEARAEVARVRQEVTALDERAAAIVANAADLKRFYESVIGPESEELVPALRDIERMARAPGLQPGARHFTRRTIMDAAVERVEVTVPLEGSYHQLVGFLEEVEGSPRFLTIDAIGLSGERDSGGQLLVQMSAYMGLPPGTSVRRGRGVAR